MINILDLTFEDAEISKVGLLSVERCRLMWFAAAEYRKSLAGE